jgi:hypothetical protein
MDKKEVLGARHISENCTCEDCMWADGLPPYEDGYKKASCMMYPYPETKPKEVYFDGTECEYKNILPF